MSFAWLYWLVENYYFHQFDLVVLYTSEPNWLGRWLGIKPGSYWISSHPFGTVCIDGKDMKKKTVPLPLGKTTTVVFGMTIYNVTVSEGGFIKIHRLFQKRGRVFQTLEYVLD